MAGDEFSLLFDKTPPTTARSGVPFTISVIIDVKPIGTQQLVVNQLVVNASLRDQAGTAATGLSGSLTATVHSRPGNTTSGYATLGNLTISQVGIFKLRVMLSVSSYSGVVTKEFVDSAVIEVGAAA